MDAGDDDSDRGLDSGVAGVAGSEEYCTGVEMRDGMTISSAGPCKNEDVVEGKDTDGGAKGGRVSSRASTTVWRQLSRS